MRRDMIYGLIASACIHGGAVWISESVGHPTRKVKIVAEEKVIQLEMPPIEHEEPDKVIVDEDQGPPIDFAPPMQADVPQLVQLDSFVQPLQPPPPDNLKPNATVVVIPQNVGHGLGKGIEVFDISKLDQAPMARFQALPEYPFAMRHAGIEGEVVVDFIVDPNGDCRNVFAYTSTQVAFEPPAVTAVNKWKFRPGKKGGKAVYTHLRVPVIFSLNR